VPETAEQVDTRMEGKLTMSLVVRVFDWQ